MIRYLVVSVCLTQFAAAAAAQEWAAKMFETTSHSFGSVARNAKADFAFKFKNKYKEDVHVAGVRTSCQCATARIVNPTLKTHETGEIVVDFNTRAFLGYRGATVTVTLDRPFPAEVQLRIDGTIRSDVVFTPGVVNFGTVDQGTAGQQRVHIEHVGDEAWRINDVQSASDHFEVEIARRAGGGRVAYDMLVRLKPDAPAGYLNDQLVIVTNDRDAERIPLAVEGQVVPEFRVSPDSLYLGEVATGGEVTKRLVVRGKRPFKIVEVDCKDDCLEFKASPEAKALHIVAVTFKARTPGKVQETVRLYTDRGEDAAASLVVYADVQPAEQ